MGDWIYQHQELLAWLGGLSVVMLLGSAILVPVLVARMSADYFLPDRDPDQALATRHPVIRWTGIILKNLLGVTLFLAGVAMLFLPGQGLLTMFIGMLLADFPGKQALELRLIRFRAIHAAIAWIRSKAGRDPLLLPPRQGSATEISAETDGPHAGRPRQDA